MAKKLTAKEAKKLAGKKDNDSNEPVLEIKKGETLDLSGGAQYHDFEAEATFVGKYVREHWANVTDKKTKKVENKCIGYIFVNEEDEEEMISNSAAIEKALARKVNNVEAKELPLIWTITFQGKSKLADGRPFNKFKIEVEMQ